MCSSMHFLEDALEHVDGLPEVIRQRCELIKTHDRDVERLKLENQLMERNLWSPDNKMSDEEKLEKACEIMENYAKMKELSDEKVKLSRRLSILMQRLSEKTKEYQEFFKCELEVDDPGCTAPIEKRFVREWELSQMEKVDPLESDESARCSPAEGVVPCHNTHEERKPFGKERPTKGRPPKNPKPYALSPSPFDDGRKNKKKGKDVPLSAYMRKKRERMREQQKMQEIHARREEERRRKNPVQVPQIDLPKFLSEAAGTNIETPRPTSSTPSGDPEDGMSWNGGDIGDLGDLGLSDDEFELMGLFPTLPSPPREIMDALGEDSLFSMDDDALSSSLGCASDSLSPMYPLSYEPESIVNSPSPIKMPPMHNDTPSERKKKITFGSSSDTSMHGRPRKLTGRAAESVLQTEEKIKKREEIVQQQGQLQLSQEDEKWCFCRTGSFGTMICCDAKNCPIGWFHVECLGIATPPQEVAWFCPECEKKTEK